jgi:hypothetical protein
MYTSMLGLALAVALCSPDSLPAPTWHTDYALARKEATRLEKPLAVIVAAGEKGWEQLTSDGRLTGAALVALRSQYVCVYVNTATKAGRKLADDFAFADGPALVLSDRGGDNQAYRRYGALADGELRRVLAKYAESERVAQATEWSGLRPAAPLQPVFTPATLNHCPT